MGTRNARVGEAEPITLIIEKLVPGGDGLARHDGKVVFVPAVLPGEKVRARILEAKKDFARASLVEILEASPMRIEPPCPVAGRCGGCDWQHIDYAEQLRQKVAMTADALRRTGGLEFPGLAIEPGKPLRYRNRAQIHRDPGGRAGFLAKASHDIVPVTSCPVAHPALDTLLRADGPADPGAAGVAGHRGSGPRQDERFAAWAHTLPASAGGKDFLVSGAAGPSEPGYQPSGFSEPGFPVEILGREIHFDLRCFFQSNLEMLAKLLPYALDGLAGREAMDLYCGVGLFGAFLKDRFDRVVAVEENAVALAYARRNIGPGRTESGRTESGHLFLQGRLEDLIAEGRPELISARPEVILVDPPRPGLDAGVRAYLADKQPPRLIYVSCNPVTLARDLKTLLAEGFVLEDLRLFDFYPQTAHVEAVAKLKKA